MKSGSKVHYRQTESHLNLRDIDLQHQIGQCNNIKNQLEYRKYLEALRNKKTDSLFSVYSRSMFINEKSLPHPQEEQKQFVYQPKKLLIKWSSEGQEQVTDEMLKISEQVDYSLSHNRLQPVKKLCQSKNQNTNLDFDQDQQKIQSQLRYANDGIKCNQVDKILEDKVNISLFENKENKQELSNQIRKVKTKPLKKQNDVMNFQVRNRNRLNNIFEKTEPKGIILKSKQTILDMEKKKSQGRPNQVHKQSIQKKGERDLKDILQKYRKKLKKISCKNKIDVGEKMKECIFLNQYMKKARKYENLDILSSIIAEKWVPSIYTAQIQPQETQEQEYHHKLTNCELKRKCLQKFSYLSKLDLLKL